MLNAVLKTVAELLAGGTSLISTEQIDFGPPSFIDKGVGPLLNLYLYDIRESKQVQHSGRQVQRQVSDRGLSSSKVSWVPDWYDLSLVITAWDRTVLGECQLLTEAASVLLRHRSLQEDFLALELQKYGTLSLFVSSEPPIDIGTLWSALSLPLRPAIYLSIAVPFEAQTTIKPVVWERMFSLKNSLEDDETPQALARRVAVAGVVKSTSDSSPVAEASITIQETDKRVSSDREGIFFVENLSNGNYVLNLKRKGYRSTQCNVLVDNATPVFKEIRLAPCS